MAIPHFRRAGGDLPSGTHLAHLKEVEKRFGFSPRRRELIQFGLVPVCEELQGLGVKDLYLGGSLITGKLSPRDIDGYVILQFASIAHLAFVERQEHWLKHNRVDLVPAFEGLSGCSVEEWEDHLSHGRGDVKTVRRIVRLLLRG